MKKSKEMNQEKKLSFEEALKKVEEIASALEDGDLPLQKRVEKFEEGIRLLKQCDDELKEVDLTIQKVIDKNEKIELDEIKNL